MNKRKIYIVGPAKHYANWMQGELVNQIKESDLVVFTGGEDVDPVLYGEKEHPYTSSNIHRDVDEMEAFDEAKEFDKPCIGICRGHQFLCVMAGGKLIQHQGNPGTHPMDMYDGATITTTSLHHQAAFPFNLPKEDYKILGWTYKLNGKHEDAKGKEMNPPKEIEVAIFKKIKALGIQGHPEMMDRDSDSIKYFQNLLNKFLNNELYNI